MTEPVAGDLHGLKLVCWECSRGGFWLLPGDLSWTCQRCGSEHVKVVPIGREVKAMGFKKHGVGEVVAVEETDLTKIASKSFTKEDEEALARENDDEEF